MTDLYDTTTQSYLSAEVLRGRRQSTPAVARPRPRAGTPPAARPAPTIGGNTSSTRSWSTTTKPSHDHSLHMLGISIRGDCRRGGASGSSRSQVYRRGRWLQFVLVGLPDAAVKESQDRVCSAINNSGYKDARHLAAPPSTRPRATCKARPGLRPADRTRHPRLHETVQVRPPRRASSLQVNSASPANPPRPRCLAMAMLARKLGKRGLIIPAESIDEAVLVSDIEVYAVHSLDEAVRFLNHALRALLPAPSCVQRAITYSHA